MDEVAFESLAARTLERLAQATEDAGAELEVDLQGGILTIEAEDGRQMIVNKHAANREIWLSSPISGAGHFAPEGAGWRNTRTGEDLFARIAQDLSQLTGSPVTLA
jgi:frataxin